MSKKCRYLLWLPLIGNKPKEKEEEFLVSTPAKLIFRFVKNTTPVERFVTCQARPNVTRPRNVRLVNEASHNLTLIDLQNCRGQSHDNAWTMSRKFSGLQAKTLQRTNLRNGFSSQHTLKFNRKTFIRMLSSFCSIF